jgi:pimeloyl-ACP methyl ester carboxylesterase
MVAMLPGPNRFETPVAGLSVHALRKGDGPMLVVLHHSFGNPGWLPFYDDLARDFTVIVPHLPGFGTSDRPDWARHPRDLALLIGYWLRKQTLSNVTIVGCGFGGWVAAELATMAPEGVRDLVLVGAAGLLPEQGRILDQMLIAHGEYVKSAFHDPEAYVAIYGETYDDDTLLQWDINREMIVRVAWKPYMYNRQMAPLLAELAVPTLLVWGEHDAVVPFECAEHYARLLPDARIEVVADCGHAVDMERPAELATLIRRHAGLLELETKG